ncbi:MAG: hypothetical protein B6D59_04255 [Campylobacteraceae bacterium 4484_4]|nr:MAG: hypothetical protein B6D59_04255 [Campylobacteraceae bacterium 4484_4]
MKTITKISLIAAAALLISACGGSVAPEGAITVNEAVGGTNTGLSSDAGQQMTDGQSEVVEASTPVAPAEMQEGADTTGIERGALSRADAPTIRSLFFPANNGATGIELYRYDIASNTVTFTDIRAGVAGSRPTFITEVNGKLYFAANNGIDGRELWIYDGATNTASIRNLNTSGGAGSNPRFITELGGKLYFSADDGTGEGRELYYYDIATNQHGYVRNHLLQTLRPGAAGSDPRDLKVQDGVLYFSANDGSGVGRELYRYDPINDVDSGPVRIADVNPAPFSGSNPIFMANIDGKIYFSADDGATGRELWKYDSVTNTTTQIRDINPGAAGSNPMFLAAVNGMIFFTADNGNPAIGPNVELMKYDTNLDMMSTAADISLVFGSYPSYLTEMNGDLYFGAYSEVTINSSGNIKYTGYELWKYNIASGATSLVDDLAKGIFQDSGPFWITEANGMLYFGAQDSPLNGRELWKSDGVNQSMPTGNFNPGAGHFLPSPVIYNFPYEKIVKTTW